MSVKEAVLAALKELILPELQLLKQEQAEVKTTLGLTNKRLDDINAHLVDQSRRIDTLGARLDAVREELGARIDAVREELGARIDTLSNRLDAVREELGARIDTLSNRIDAVREELGARIDTLSTRLDTLGARLDAVREELGTRLDDTNKRLDRLYEVIVRREEHYGLEVRVSTLEQEVSALKKGLAA